MPIGLSCFPLCWDWGIQGCAVRLELGEAALLGRLCGSVELLPSSTSQPRYQLRPCTQGRGALSVQLMLSLSQIAGTICASPT